MYKYRPHDAIETVLRPHDLLWITDVESLISELPLPAWASPEWLVAAPVVMRREQVDDAQWLPVGLRGQTRSERFKALLSVNAVAHCVPPEFLVSAEAWKLHGQYDVFPAVQALVNIAPLLNTMGLCWGPTGSVGFALASGLPVLHDASDLDLVVRASSPLPLATVKLLKTLLVSHLCRIDMQIDTGNGGFAFAEWVSGRNSVLLKTNTGPILTADPWAKIHQPPFRPIR
ncbi:malonate decarboxylase holo-ACP synthase [Glaciimonas immobilis]|uniref:Phosphoribosyl-dephospho-CoA transferase n=1 Tax=Glaciimonas immobilis TaxID=728004 RepID=A0A840RJZ2_9BURK|nr:malonate decarboxylase holo-ACP synthase [Glaciimonas immobilis]KAF3999085.1 malonate decarboxylase holo-ACP synthase [Glaciimonas immobilis]MBB5198517.1 phosphoribosyl-dephospho-CoA transferase [Glaciimonas immobilis]